KRSEVRLAVVVAAAAKAQWDDRQDRNQDADDRDPDQAEAQPGREERRDIRVEDDICAGEDRPGGIDDERAVADDGESRLDQPGPSWRCLLGRRWPRS